MRPRTVGLARSGQKSTMNDPAAGGAEPEDGERSPVMYRKNRLTL